MNAILSVARFSFARRAAGLRLLGPGVIALLPTVMMALILLDPDAPETYDLYRNYMVPVTLYFVLPLVCMFVMLPILSELYEKGSIGYLFTRPVPRWKPLLGLFLGGYGATMPVFLVGVLAPALIGMSFDASVGMQEWFTLVLNVTLLLWIAGLAYGSICLFLGVYTKRPIIWAFVIMFGFGSALGSIPGEGQMWSLHYYLISLAYRWCGITGSKTDLFSPLETVASTGLSITVLVGATAFLLFLTSWAARRRDIL